ncbi:MAG: ComF family protein [Candidatus Limivicinus sp.]|jgi:competence protein ComFC
MRLYNRILDLLYPWRCPFCGKLTDGNLLVCRDCMRKLPYVPPQFQRQSLRYIDICISPLYYEGRLRESFLRYKFGGASVYAEVYAYFMSKCIDENRINCDIITWVPVSRQRLRKRGYDQAELLAGYVASSLGRECKSTLLKVRNNPAQSGTAGADVRRANVKGAYRAADPELIEGRSLLLIDDIITTGSTLTECARVLRMNGAKSITALTLARNKM